MQTVEPLLGTRAEVHVTADSKPAATRAENRVVQEVKRLERLFTVFDSSSALNELRRTGATSVRELVEVCELAAEWRQRSAGAFDPRIQLLMELWDQGEAAGAVPSPRALANALAARDQLGRPIDNLNAIAKGWIAQAALTLIDMATTEIHAAWLSLGGDVAHCGSGSIAVAVEDPHRPYDNVAPLASIEISNEAVATSGGARRWWTIGGRRYPKTLDPRTGQPVERVAAATIVAADAAIADVLATIATVTNTDETLKLCHAAGAQCLLIHPDRSRTCSSDRFVFH